MSPDPLPVPSRRLRDALVAAYAPFVWERLGELRSIEGLDEAIEAGREWLESALSGLLSKPFPAQDRGPLELFQEAMKFPTEALAEAGQESVRRDDVAVAALPGDLYDLAPASTRELGEEVWMIHLRWGAAKAAAMTSPE
ncbi:MAG: hypothetical protein WB239_08665 [Acidimicrobiia bacterium]